MTVILLGTSWKRWLASCWPNDKDEADHPREVRSVPKNVRFTPVLRRGFLIGRCAGRDSAITYEFSVRRACAEKRMSFQCTARAALIGRFSMCPRKRLRFWEGSRCSRPNATAAESERFAPRRSTNGRQLRGWRQCPIRSLEVMRRERVQQTLNNRDASPVPIRDAENLCCRHRAAR